MVILIFSLSLHKTFSPNLIVTENLTKMHEFRKQKD